jgi:lipopolysaccharide biosynthesis protein
MVRRGMPRILSFYLPQFYPIAENDEWWGKGFTEWTSVTRAKPLFPGHYQPHLPGELGFYDLRLPETRAAQAKLAREHGIYGFCYYHYWLHGRRLLDRPLEEVLALREPDFPFCMCWANHNWTRTWSGGDREVLLEQRYSRADDLEHIRYLIPFFLDPRYVKVQGKPVFMIYRVEDLDDLEATLQVWREELAKVGIPGLYLVWMESNHLATPLDFTARGLDAACEFQPRSGIAGSPKPVWLRGKARKLLPGPYGTHQVREYDRLVRGALGRPTPTYKRFPCVTPAWDNSPRRAAPLQASIWVNSTPEAYGRWLEQTLLRFRPFGPDEDFVLINAWNEWAEGNHLEPDQKWGRAYLEATRRAVELTA